MKFYENWNKIYTAKVLICQEKFLYKFHVFNNNIVNSVNVR